MSVRLRFDIWIRMLVLGAAVLPCMAQVAPTSDNPVQVGSPQNQGTQSQQAVQQRTPPPQDPYIIEDGGLSIEPIYWLTRAQPTLRGGAIATGFGGLDYPGNSKNPLGGELGIPAGRSNTLRLSYFRVQGNANSTAAQDTTIFSEAYSAGDYLSSSYTLQNAKISWDYLGYAWYRSAGKIRLKTLYEVQYTTISTNVDAPFKALTADASGNTNPNTAHGSKSIIYPALGVEFEQALGHHFRWEAKGSGFGIPHRGNIWDAQGAVAFRFGQVEILAGEKAFHFKTSPKGDQYFVDTLSGAYAGIRYYWGRPQ